MLETPNETSKFASTSPFLIKRCSPKCAKYSKKQVLSEQRGPLATISANRSLHTNSPKTICFCAFGQHSCDHFGHKSADPKNWKKTVPGPRRPDQSRGAQRPSKTTSKEPKKSKTDERQMLKNKAPEHRSPNSKGKPRVKTHVFPKCWKTKH